MPDSLSSPFQPCSYQPEELQRRTWTMPFSGLISSVFLEALHATGHMRRPKPCTPTH